MPKNDVRPTDTLPAYTLKNNIWIRGGEWDENSRFIILYKIVNGVFIPYGVGIY